MGVRWPGERVATATLCPSSGPRTILTESVQDDVSERFGDYVGKCRNSLTYFVAPNAPTMFDCSKTPATSTCCEP